MSGPLLMIFIAPPAINCFVNYIHNSLTAHDCFIVHGIHCTLKSTYIDVCWANKDYFQNE